MVAAGAYGIAAAALCPSAWAVPALPAGKVVLTVSGRITMVNSGNSAVFDLPMLESLGTTGFVTSTPWYGAPVRFEGVLMRRLLQAVGAQGSRITASALNDYITEIPLEDFERYDVILAFRRDGEYMPVRDKGPLFIVYPYDAAPELRSQKYYSRSAWQVVRLDVA